jgi:hypothetical protein
MFSSAAGGPNSPPLIIVALFLGVGLYLTFGRFIVDVARRSRIYYGLTNQRVIIVGGVLQRKVTSINLNTMSELSLTERRYRKGTIEFGRARLPWYAMGLEIWSPGLMNAGVFERISDAKQVYEMIRSAQRPAA